MVMGTNSGKLAVGLLLLISVWVGVYWLYEPSRPPITMDPARASDGAAAPPLMQVDREPAMPPEAQRVPTPQTQPGSPQRPLAVVPPEFVEYTVQPGDTFESISRQFYGSPAHADAITRANGLGDAGRLLTPGRTIRIAKDPGNLQGKPPAKPLADATPATPPPPVKPAADSVPQVKAPRTYTVQSGDSLSKIAQRFYDNASQWERIYEANKAHMKGPHDLKVGAVLTIPD